MSQNLFRQFLYISTSSFYNWVSINASGIREAGPFTDQNLHSRELSGNAGIHSGPPLGHILRCSPATPHAIYFPPMVEEYFNTTSYIGLQHKFGSRLTVAALAEDLRSWRVQNTQYAIAEALLPGARFEFRANPRWKFQGSFLLSRGMGYHEYDNAQSEFLVSYTRPIPGSPKIEPAKSPVAYPLRFSFGVQQQTFYDFSGSRRT